MNRVDIQLEELEIEKDDNCAFDNSYPCVYIVKPSFNSQDTDLLPKKFSIHNQSSCICTYIMPKILTL